MLRFEASPAPFKFLALRLTQKVKLAAECVQPQSRLLGKATQHSNVAAVSVFTVMCLNVEMDQKRLQTKNHCFTSLLGWRPSLLV